MAGRAQWQNGEVVAWTERDGVGPRPKGPSRILPIALTATLGAVLFGIFRAGTLCPEHRTWVATLGLLGIAGTGVAIFALVQRWAIAPLLTLIVALDGVAIGLIDAIHNPDRGHMIALGFGFSALMAIALAASSIPLSVWDRRVRRSLVSAPMPVATSDAPAPASADAPEADATPTVARDEAQLTSHE